MGISLSILLSLILVMLGIPFWVSLGLGTAALLWSTGDRKSVV